MRMTLEEFITENFAALARLASSLAGDRHTSEDVLAEALVKVTIHWRRVQAAAFPLAYARRIVATTYLNTLRIPSSRHEVMTPPEAMPISEAPQPFFALEDRDAVQSILRRLTGAQRTAVAMRYLFQETDRDIAILLGCSEATVRSHISHARRRIERIAAQLNRENEGT